MITDIKPIVPGTAPSSAAPLIIAGPCSAESAAQVDTAARLLSGCGISVFRAGVWKPRTRPGGFEGIGRPALEWIVEAGRRYDMLTATEAATPAHVHMALEAGIDILWIGGRTTANPFAVQEIADALGAVNTDVPVLVKNPVSPDLELWIGALMRLYGAGIRRLGAVHRGFSTYGHGPYRNTPHWSIPFELRRRVPALPVICDPSHISGRADLVPDVAVKAIEMGFDGLMIESHPTPQCALSDAAQQLTPDSLAALLRSLPHHSAPSQNAELEEFRRQIDAIDDELLEVVARRMAVSAEIGRLKARHSMAVVQPDRYNTLIERRTAQGAELGLSPECTRRIFSALHEESVRRQLTKNN